MVEEKLRLDHDFIVKFMSNCIFNTVIIGNYRLYCFAGYKKLYFHDSLQLQE